MTKEELPNQIDTRMLDEINNFYKERERIRDAIGKIGGIQYSKADTIVNIIFIILVVGFFSIELVFRPLPTTVSIEIGVFLVSPKLSDSSQNGVGSTII